MRDSNLPEPISAASYLDYDYDRFYARHDFGYAEKVEMAFLRVILQGTLHLPVGASIIDLGCGTGYDTMLMARMGYRSLGVDTSGVAIQKAREREGAAQFIVADALNDHDAIAQQFDLAYCSGFMAFNWVSSPQSPEGPAAARALLAHVRPGGWLVFVWDSLLTGRRWSPYPDVAPERMLMNYTVAQAQALWQAGGDCRVIQAGATHKRLALLLGRAALSRVVDSLITQLAHRLHRPVQIVAIIQRDADPE